jgi:hypothetical protein
VVKLTPGAADILRLGGVALASQFRNPKTQQAIADSAGVLANAAEKGIGFEELRERRSLPRKRNPRRRS